MPPLRQVERDRLTQRTVQHEAERTLLVVGADEDDGALQFLMARKASLFSNLKLTNRSGPERLVSDSVEEVVEKLNRQLDAEDEDRVAILTAPSKLAGLAVLKYATERVMASAPGNIQELREKGFL